MKFVEAVEHLNTKAKSEDITWFLHNLSLQVNKYAVFGSMATKMANAYKKPKDYALNTVSALYL